MKKTLCMFLAICMAVLLFGCGGSSTGEVKQPTNTGESNQETQSKSDSQDESSVPEEEETTLSEQVLLDADGIKITAKGISDGFMGKDLNLLIENDSGTDLTFQARNSSANGYMIETMFSADVMNGKKANDSITFLASDLQMCGIDTIADIEFSFHIFTTDGWEDFLDSDMIRLETSAADGFAYDYDDSGELLCDENGVKIITQGLASDASYLGYGLLLYIENNSDNPITVQSRDVSVNGFMIDGMLSKDVMPGKRAITDLTLPDYEMEANGITDITDMEFSLHVFNMETWSDIFDTSPIALEFE